MRQLSVARTSQPWLLSGLLLLGLGLPSALPAADIAVPTDVATIQGAITSASAGDVVLVAPGTYLELIDFAGKAITVRSTDGPATTIIDGQFAGSVVTFDSGETSQSVLEGLTIRNGQILGLDASVGGGGIFISGASPTIRGNVISDNSVSWRGAGIYCVDSNALIVENDFIGNSFFTFVSDIPFGLGAGIAVSGGSVEIGENRFFDNNGGDRGGAIFLENTIATQVRSNICIDNASGYGGAIAVTGVSNVTIENLLAVGNTSLGLSSLAGLSPGRGGAIYLADASTVTMRGLTLIGNTAVDGFGFQSGPGEGGGVFAETTMAIPPLLRDAIVRGNIASGFSPQVDPSVFVDHSNIEGGFPSGTNVIDADPLFVTGPAGNYYLSQVTAGQGATSPSVDSGNPSSLPFAQTTTRTDEGSDTGTIDQGFHFAVSNEVQFLRGDCNGDSGQNIADAIFALAVIFPGPIITPAANCFDACDANDDGNLNIADPIAILNSLFGSPPAPLPPPSTGCGADPTADGLDCDLSPGC